VTVAGGTAATGDGPSAAEPVVILSGNLGYRPTIRAALWFADRVWPRVLDSVPSAKWVLAGARPGAAIRRLASRPGVEVHSDVGDLGGFLRRARVAIAPMASGSGVPIKILEAMAAGVPVVADPWSADGLEDPSAVVAVHDEVEWIDALRRLLTDSGAAREQAVKGAEVWRAHYAPDRVGARIREAVMVAARRRSSGHQ
jgi:glycosyltransferase involved in cell wall biosynthesis